MIIEIFGERLKWDTKTRRWKSSSRYADQLNGETNPTAIDPNPELTALEQARSWFPDLVVIEEPKVAPVEYDPSAIY